MDFTREEKKRKEFRDILLELASHDNLFQTDEAATKIYVRLENLYYSPDQEDFRHFYSDIFVVLAHIQDKSMFGTLETLGQNLNFIYCNYKVQEHDISLSIRKLYDHVNLDIARLSQFDAILYKETGEQELNTLRASNKDVQEKLNAIREEFVNTKDDLYNAKEEFSKSKAEFTIAQAELTKAQEQLVQIKKEHDKIKKEHTKVKEELSDAKKEYIAILGIFSAVALTFISGITFTASVLANIHLSSIYRIVLIVLLIGLVLYNSLALLFSSIHKLSRSAPATKANLKENGKGRIDKTLWRFISSPNGIFLVLIIVVIISWRCGWVENRNANINNPQTSITESLPEEDEIEESTSEESTSEESTSEESTSEESTSTNESTPTPVS